MQQELIFETCRVFLECLRYASIFRFISHCG